MSRRKQRLANDIDIFMRKYSRKRSPGSDPNDRDYDRKVEEMVKRMDPMELDALLRGEDDEPLDEEDEFLPR